MFKYDPEKILCDIKFVPIKEYLNGHPQYSNCWSNGWISEDGKTFYEENRPDFMNYLLQMWEAGIVIKRYLNLPPLSLAAYRPLHFHVTTSFSNHPVN